MQSVLVNGGVATSARPVAGQARPVAAVSANVRAASRAVIAQATSKVRGAVNAPDDAAPALIGKPAAAKKVPTDLPPVERTSRPMKIVFVSAEVAPWSKTGGLGDVVGALPLELARRGHKVMTVSPRYDQYYDAWDTSVTTNIMGKEVRYFHTVDQGVDRVWVDNPLFLAKVWGKTGSKIYGAKAGADYEDNQVRFRIFSEAAIEACRKLPFGYGEDVVFVANDWHSAMVPALLKNVYKPRGEFAKAKTAFCIHNIAFQGRFPDASFGELNLPGSAKGAFAFADSVPYDKAAGKASGKFAKINWMKAGFMTADKLLTVSPTYASEVSANAEKGVELDVVIRAAGGIEGIVNGMDASEWHPKKDKYLDVKYDASTVFQGKAVAKATLQAECGLPVNPSAPLFAFIGRLEEQKGVDIMLKAIPGIVAAGGQVVVLGTGKKEFEVAVKALEKSNPGAKGVVKFSAALAHIITAGADFMLVPSRFEPCGLIQLHAMQYGTVPVVASTGGLVDTVKEGVTGFHMGAMDPDTVTSADVAAVTAACRKAISSFSTPGHKAMVQRCIFQDLTWREPAKKWEGVLEEIAYSESQAVKKAQVATPVMAMA